MMKKVNKPLLIIIAIIIVVILGIVWGIDLNRSATLNILVTPLDSKIIINGREYSNGVYRFFPGKISVKIEHDGLDTKEYDLELQPSATTLIHEYLTSNGDFSYYTEHKKDYDALKYVYDDNALSFINKQEVAKTITKLLPINTLRYHDSSYHNIIVRDGTLQSNCEKIVCLSIVDDTENHSASVELLKEYGYDANDYRIIYVTK